MSKKKKKSRFTKTDVNTICEMQRKIDAYESYIIGLHGLLQNRRVKRYIIFLRDTELDNLVNDCCHMIEYLVDKEDEVRKTKGEAGFQELLDQWEEKRKEKIKGED